MAINALFRVPVTRYHRHSHKPFPVQRKSSTNQKRTAQNREQTGVTNAWTTSMSTATRSHVESSKVWSATNDGDMTRAGTRGKLHLVGMFLDVSDGMESRLRRLYSRRLCLFNYLGFFFRLRDANGDDLRSTTRQQLPQEIRGQRRELA